MPIADFATNPTGICTNLKCTGPNGFNPAPAALTVSCPVTSPTASAQNDEKISVIDHAITSGEASLGVPGPTNRLITVTAAGTANCYWLPWGSGKVYSGQLGASHDFFFTYTINGCGIIIGGTTAAPFVAHANLESKRLAAPDTTGKSMPEIISMMAETTKNQGQVYEHFYGNLAAKLIEQGKLNGPKVTVITPQEYLVEAGASFGVIFGIRRGGNWEFYGNWARKTKRVW